MKVLFISIILMLNACSVMKKRSESEVRYQAYDAIGDQDRKQLQDLLDKEI